MKKIRTVAVVLVIISLAIAAWIVILLKAGLPHNPPQAEADYLKIITTSEGIYELSSEAIESLGVSWKADYSEDLVVIQFGRQVPFWVSGSGRNQILTFYAPQFSNRYTHEMVTLLIPQKAAANWGFSFQGGELDETSLEQNVASIRAITPGGVVQKERIETNRVFQPLVESGERWMGEALMAPAEIQVNFMLRHLVVEDGKILVELWASTEANGTPDHHLVFSLNGKPIGESLWDGKGRRQVALDIGAEFFLEGENRLTLTAPGDTGAIADFIWLDWVEVETVQSLEVERGPFSFWGQGQEYQVKGNITSAEVYDVTEPSSPFQVALGETRPDGWFGIDGRRYLIIGKGDANQPGRVEPVSLRPNLKSDGFQAQYLAIGPAEYLERLTPLLDLREREGLLVKAVEDRLVYEQFNNGIKSPLAIKAFLRWGREHWEVKPQYLLLVGDASYDPRGYLPGGAEDVLPTFFVSTRYGGETTSDYPFSTDDLETAEGQFLLSAPVMAVGRIPAQEPAQVSALVEKILAYEVKNDRRGGQRILAIADRQDPSFTFDAQKYMQLFSNTAEVFTPDGAGQVINRIDQGYDWVMYFGHGSIQQWGKDKFLSIEDLSEQATLTVHFPIYMQFTCLTGLFSHPSYTSLTEALLWQAGGGAIASLAPTSLTLPTDQGYLVDALIEVINSREYQRLGDAYAAAIQKVALTQPQSVDVIETFLLLGDPSLHLP